MRDYSAKKDLFGAKISNVYSAEVKDSFSAGKHEFMEENGQNVVFLLKDNGVHRLFFLLEDFDGFQEMIDSIPDSLRPFVTEIVFTGQEPTYVEDLTRAGFIKYAKLFYMTRKCSTTIQDTDCDVLHATVSDAIEILKALYDSFDPKISHLPSTAQLERIIAQGNSLVIQKGEKIASFAIIETTGKKTKYLYQLLTLPEFQGLGLASQLMKEIVGDIGGSSILSLWVEEKNMKAIKLYNEFGFSRMGRATLVLKKE